MSEHYYTWVMNPNATHCMSCLDLDGHTHLKSEWIAAGLYPGCLQLECTTSCKCHLEDVGAEAAPAGDLSAVYLIAAAAELYGHWAIDEKSKALKFVVEGEVERYEGPGPHGAGHEEPTPKGVQKLHTPTPRRVSRSETGVRKPHQEVKIWKKN